MKNTRLRTHRILTWVSATWVSAIRYLEFALLLIIILGRASVAATEGMIQPSIAAHDLARPILGNGKQHGAATTCPATNNWRDIQIEYFQPPACLETRWGRGKNLLDEGRASKYETAPMIGSHTRSSTFIISATSSDRPTATSMKDAQTDHDFDTESLLDNANFLSFEDWKKQNLAKIGQSAENVGGRRQNAGPESRRRPSSLNNVLDSLGEDSEIELDFGGFGTEGPENPKQAPWDTRLSSDRSISGTVDGVEQAPEDTLAEGTSPGGVTRRKDAGTTCKERFNYASFDCAATVLKTNPQCTGSSSVLIENKDSYMLNECGAENKFIILELCDDILIDTIVLANYEFFSSIFRTFRISISDRYPVKLDKWKELGIFEARNTREIQAFPVDNPLIWARYVKAEFLTHYGNEFYCPVSLIRVHGTTMMEEYKNDGEIGRSEEVDESSDAETSVNIDITEPKNVAPPQDNVTISTLMDPEPGPNICSRNEAARGQVFPYGSGLVVDFCPIHEAPSPSPNVSTGPVQIRSAVITTVVNSSGYYPSESGEVDPRSTSARESSPEQPWDATAFSNTSATEAQTVEHCSQTEAETRPIVTTSKDGTSVANEPTKPTALQAPSPNPTTQESFFKSVNKRLQMLESNSSLSLLYIEEQSRILRDAFNKVERRQLAKTSTFLENLNTTVLNELHEFREQYDQVWKSVIIEFEHQRFQYHQELYSITTQLGVLADELVFQKRVSIIQSIFVLMCFGLVLFSRGSVGNYIELPSVQSMVSRSYGLRSPSPAFGTPSMSPSSTWLTSSYREKRGGGHRRHLLDDSQGGGEPNLSVSDSPPTPHTDAGSGRSDAEEKMEHSSMTFSGIGTPDPRDLEDHPILDAGSSNGGEP